MKKIVFASALSLMMFVSCKKDKDDDKTTAELVAGTWKVSKVITRENFASTGFYEYTYTGLATDYFNFKSDGILEAKYDGSTDIEPYQIQGDTAIVIAGISHKITKLSSSELSLYSRQTFTGDYTEDVYELKR